MCIEYHEKVLIIFFVLDADLLNACPVIEPVSERRSTTYVFFFTIRLYNFVEGSTVQRLVLRPKSFVPYYSDKVRPSKIST